MSPTDSAHRDRETSQSHLEDEAVMRAEADGKREARLGADPITIVTTDLTAFGCGCAE